jgi:hypothetical protein
MFKQTLPKCSNKLLAKTIEDQTKFLKLLTRKQTCDVFYIAIGTAYVKEQILPKFITNMAKLWPDKNFCSIAIDSVFYFDLDLIPKHLNIMEENTETFSLDIKKDIDFPPFYKNHAIEFLVNLEFYKKLTFFKKSFTNFKTKQPKTRKDIIEAQNNNITISLVPNEFLDSAFTLSAYLSKGLLTEELTKDRNKYIQTIHKWLYNFFEFLLKNGKILIISDDFGPGQGFNHFYDLLLTISKLKKIYLDQLIFYMIGSGLENCNFYIYDPPETLTTEPRQLPWNTNYENQIIEDPIVNKCAQLETLDITLKQGKNRKLRVEISGTVLGPEYV